MKNSRRYEVQPNPEGVDVRPSGDRPGGDMKIGSDAPIKFDHQIVDLRAERPGNRIVCYAPKKVAERIADLLERDADASSAATNDACDGFR